MGCIYHSAIKNTDTKEGAKGCIHNLTFTPSYDFQFSSTFQFVVINSPMIYTVTPFYFIYMIKLLWLIISNFT